MAFKLTNPPYKIDNTPVYHVDMEAGVMGKANNNGTIILNKDLKPHQIPEVIAHERVHIDQMRRGDLDMMIIMYIGKVKNTQELK